MICAVRSGLPLVSKTEISIERIEQGEFMSLVTVVKEYRPIEHRTALGNLDG